MINYEEKEIDGHMWKVSQFTATEGLKILSRLVKLLGGPIGKALTGLKGDGSILDAKIDFGMLGSAMGELTERLDEEEIANLVKKLLSNTRCDGKEVAGQFDLLFMGRYGMLFRVLAFVVGVNYKVPLADYLQLATGPRQEALIPELS